MANRRDPATADRRRMPRGGEGTEGGAMVVGGTSMPIKTQIDVDAGLRTHIVKGEMTYDGLSSTLEAVYTSPDFRPEFDALWDLRGAILTAFSSSDVGRVVDLVRGNWTGAKAALVVARDADFGMARMYELQHNSTSTGEVRVFRDFDEAKRWVMEE